MRWQECFAWVSILRSILPHCTWLVFLERRQLSPWLSFVVWIDACQIILISKDVCVNFHLRDRWLSHTNRNQDTYFETLTLEMRLEACISYRCCVTKLNYLGHYTFFIPWVGSRCDIFGVYGLGLITKFPTTVVAEKKDIPRLNQERILALLWLLIWLNFLWVVGLRPSVFCSQYGHCVSYVEWVAGKSVKMEVPDGRHGFFETSSQTYSIPLLLSYSVFFPKSHSLAPTQVETLAQGPD